MTHLVTMAARAQRWQITGKVVRWDWVESIQVDNERFALASPGNCLFCLVCVCVCVNERVGVCVSVAVWACVDVSFVPVCVCVCAGERFRSSIWFQWTCLPTSLPISADKPSVCPVHGVLFLERRRRRRRSVGGWGGGGVKECRSR